MKRLLSIVSMVPLAALLASGCVFYVHGDDDGDDDWGDDDVPSIDAGMPVPDAACVPLPVDPTTSQRNPYTGECGWPIDSCGNGTPPPVWLPWGICETECNKLDEEACRNADGCRAIYTIGMGAQAFAACWSIGLDPPPPGECNVLTDAQDCSFRDDCSAVHYPNGWGAPGEYAACQAEESPPPPPECEGLDEANCIHYDCDPIYSGSDCICDPASGECKCTTWTFETCRTPAP